MYIEKSENSSIMINRKRNIIILCLVLLTYRVLFNSVTPLALPQNYSGTSIKENPYPKKKVINFEQPKYLNMYQICILLINIIQFCYFYYFINQICYCIIIIIIITSKHFFSSSILLSFFSISIITTVLCLLVYSSHLTRVVSSQFGGREHRRTYFFYYFFKIIIIKHWDYVLNRCKVGVETYPLRDVNLLLDIYHVIIVMLFFYIFQFKHYV